MAPAVGALVAASTPISRLRPGMVVFCDRPSLMQRCNDLAGDSFRHAGVMIDTDDGLMMCGFAPKRNYCLIPVEKLAGYSRVGVADVLTGDQVQILRRWVGQFEHRPTSYPQTSVFMAGILSYARTMSPGIVRRLLVAWCLRYCHRLSRRYRDRVAFICSTFVLAALNAALDEPVLMAMTDDKFEATEYLATNASTDLLLSRWLATPSDLWRAIPLRMRSELVVDEAAAGAAAPPAPAGRSGTRPAARSRTRPGGRRGARTVTCPVRPAPSAPASVRIEGPIPAGRPAPPRADAWHPVPAATSNAARAGPGRSAAHGFVLPADDPPCEGQRAAETGSRYAMI